MLLLHRSTSPPWLELAHVGVNAATFNDVLSYTVYTLRQLRLCNITLDAHAVHALTSWLTHSTLQHFTWSGGCARNRMHDYEPCLLPLMRQWLLSPSRSLVQIDLDLDLRACVFCADHFDAFEQLVQAVVQRWAEGRPVWHVGVWGHPSDDADYLRSMAIQAGVGGIISVCRKLTARERAREAGEDFWWLL